MNIKIEDEHQNDKSSGILPQASWSLGNRSRQIALASLAILGICACIYLSIPFIGALAWALTLAILFWPVHKHIVLALNRPTIAALLSTLVVAFVIVAPLAFIVQRLTLEAVSSASYFQDKVGSKEITQLAGPDSIMAPFISFFTDKIDLPALTASGTKWLSGFVSKFLAGSFTQVIEIVLTFYFLFYLLRDRDPALNLVRKLLPLNPEEANTVLKRASDTIHATIFGTLLVSTVQGTLGGLMFWVLGVPAPIMWGIVMTLLSIIPILGAFIIWIPAAAYLALEGHYLNAAILTAWGAMVVSTIDNILRPIVVGNRLGLHTIPAFIAMLGGLISLGPPGFVLGPLIFTLTITLIETLQSRTQRMK